MKNTANKLNVQSPTERYELVLGEKRLKLGIAGCFSLLR